MSRSSSRKLAVNNPEVLFLDEPTTGLDPRSRLGLWELVRGLVSDGVTVLLTTQYLEEADALADDITVIDHGRVIASGTPAELKTMTGGQYLAVRPAAVEDVPAVVAVVGQLIGVALHVDGGLVTARIADVGVLPAVVRRLDEAGVPLVELALRTFSLDEVFFVLTGRPAPTTDAEGART